MGFWIQTSNFMFFVVNRLIKGEIEKPSCQYLGLICDESLTCHGLNSNPGHFRGSTTISLFHVEKRVWLSRGVQVTGATWREAMRNVAGVGDLVQRTGDGRTGRVLGDRTIERSGDTVCGLHRARGDEECEFLS
jgi:hypothetical protein